MKQLAKVAIVDPLPIWRAGVEKVLNEAAGFAPGGSGACASEIEGMLRADAPEVVLIDTAAEGGGAKAVRRILEISPKTRVAMFTASERRQDLMTAMAAGAHGYILKTVTPLELARALNAILAGERYITPYFAARLLASIGDSSAGRDRDSGREQLTHRESQILSEAAKGQTNKEIAQTLKLSEKTIKYYMTNVLQKLQVRNRVEAINVYREREASAL